MDKEMMNKVNEILKANGRRELSLDEAGQVVGGGHYVACPPTDKVWVDLIDSGYVYGSGDRYQDAAYFLECMASTGHCGIDVLAKYTLELLPEVGSGALEDIEKALRSGGPLYMVECLRNANGFSFRPE